MENNLENPDEVLPPDPEALNPANKELDEDDYKESESHRQHLQELAYESHRDSMNDR